MAITKGKSGGYYSGKREVVYGPPGTPAPTQKATPTAPSGGSSSSGKTAGDIVREAREEAARTGRSEIDVIREKSQEAIILQSGKTAGQLVQEQRLQDQLKTSDYGIKVTSYDQSGKQIAQKELRDLNLDEAQTVKAQVDRRKYEESINPPKSKPIEKNMLNYDQRNLLSDTAKGKTTPFDTYNERRNQMSIASYSAQEAKESKYGITKFNLDVFSPNYKRSTFKEELGTFKEKWQSKGSWGIAKEAGTEMAEQLPLFLSTYGGGLITGGYKLIAGGTKIGTTIVGETVLSSPKIGSIASAVTSSNIGKTVISGSIRWTRDTLISVPGAIATAYGTKKTISALTPKTEAEKIALKDVNYNYVFQTAMTKTSEDIKGRGFITGPVQKFFYSIPGTSLLSDYRDVYSKNILGVAKEAGYTPEQAESFKSVILKEQYAQQLGIVSGGLFSQAASELSGTGYASRAVVSTTTSYGKRMFAYGARIAPAGVQEMWGIMGSTDVSLGVKPDFKSKDFYVRYGLGGALGGLSAGVAGALVAGGSTSIVRTSKPSGILLSRTYEKIRYGSAGKEAYTSATKAAKKQYRLGQVSNVIVNILDPYEKQGDIIAHRGIDPLSMKAGMTVAKPTIRVVVPVSGFFTNVPSSSLSPISAQTKSSTPVGISQQANIWTPVQSYNPVIIPTKSPVNVFTPVTVPTPTPVTIPTKSPVNVFTPINVPIPTPVTPEVLVPPIIPVQQQTPINVPVEVPVVVPSRFPGLISSLALGGAKFGVMEKGSKRKYGYAPSLAAVYFGIKGKAPKKFGGAYTGQEFRPIIGKSGRGSFSNSFSFGSTGKTQNNPFGNMKQKSYRKEQSPSTRNPFGNMRGFSI